MSLHAAAQHLAAHGRNGDTQLVHMTRGEVRSLQDLAKAHGGSLTINPHTGLPEASFLSSVLPMAAGAGLMMIPGMQPLGAAALVGGAAYLSSGSLTKGLMAGLGAYGGAGLNAGLSNLGTSEAGANISQAAESQAAEAMKQQAAQQATQQAVAQQATQQAAAVGGPEFFTAAGASPAEMQAAKAAMIDSYVPTAAQNAMVQNPMRTGISAIMDDPSKLKALGGDQGWLGVAKYGLAGAAPFMQPKPYEPPTTTPMPNPVYTYNPGMATPAPVADPYGVEQNYFPGAGYTRMANGGTVEQMSQANSIGQNTGYPQADINKGAYATPWQTPVSRNMLAGAADTGVNPITGSMNFADGGITGDGNLNLHIPLEFGGGTAGGYTPAGGGFSGGTGATGNAGFAGYNNAPGVSAPTAQTGPVGQAPTGTTPINNSSYDGDTFIGTGAFGGTPQAAISNLFGVLGGKAMARGGLSSAASHLGDYSDGGRLLKGPGDGVSDSIPAMIGKKQPARLADGEFVVPARIVSELGNGSTEAGARQLYAMMDRVQKARSKTTGKKQVAKKTNANKLLPA